MLFEVEGKLSICEAHHYLPFQLGLRGSSFYTMNQVGYGCILPKNIPHKTMPCVKGCLKSWALCYTLAPLKPTSSKIRHHEWEKGAKNGLANLNNRMNQENTTLFGDESELIITYPHIFHRTHFWNYACSLSDMGNIPQTLRAGIFVVLTEGHGSLQIRRVSCCFCPKGRHNPSLKLDFSSRNVVIYTSGNAELG